MKKLIIAGGTGFLGSALINFLANDFDEIVCLSRKAKNSLGKLKTVSWDAKTVGDWKNELENASVIINLSGKNINCRLTEKNKKEILNSRIDATNAIGEAILLCNHPPRVWINGSATNMYANSFDKAMTETDFIPGQGFWADVCNEWERACTKHDLTHTRTVLPRVTPVFGRDGGVYPVLKSLVKKGLGGTMGSGKQRVSWIHLEDYCRCIKWMIGNDSASGPYNLCAPDAITNADQMRTMRDITGVNIGIPAPAWALEIGAFFMRTEAELILDSRFIYPARLINEGFQFKHPTFRACISDLEKKSA